MANYTDHSKFIYQNYDDIQDGINSGEINSWDVILCRDTKEMLLIRDDLSISPIKSKVYRFTSTEEAVTVLNAASDSYAGQIVSILHNGSYIGYIVNLNNFNRFYVTPLSIYNGEVDYDSLGNRPIENIVGSLQSPVYIDQLHDGIYHITGNYKLFAEAATTYMSANSNLFLVEHGDGGTTHIKKLSASEIYDYTLSSDKELTTSTVPTTEWLSSQGYVTEPYIDAKIAALNFINKNEAEAYISDIIAKTFGTVIKEQVSKELDAQLQPATEQELFHIFTNVFIKDGE